MSARSLAPAGAAVVAMLATPVAADPCSEFRLALALEDAADNVEGEALGNLSRERRETGITAEVWAEYEAPTAASTEATERVKRAMIAVRRIATDETAAMIDAMETARNAAYRAFGTAVQWTWKLGRKLRGCFGACSTLRTRPITHTENL